MTRFRKVKRDDGFIMVPYEDLTLTELVDKVLLDYGELEKDMNTLVEDIKEIKQDIIICLKPLGSYNNLNSLDAVKNNNNLRIQLDDLYNRIDYMMDLLHGKL